jgi:hypothetical protein
MIKRCWLPLIVALCLAGCNRQLSWENSPGHVYYYEETGHTVQGEFLHFFYLYGGLESLGYPLTEQITLEGWTVQYFENGRLEFHPENQPAYRVTVGWLGDLLHRRRPPIPSIAVPSAGNPNRRYFPQTGHTLSGDFLSYFDQHGGSVRFGLPISEPFLWKGSLVQDFQSARFFWTPDKATPVTLEKTGRVHFEANGLDRSLLEAVESPERPG